MHGRRDQKESVSTGSGAADVAKQLQVSPFGKRGVIAPAHLMIHIPGR